MEKGYGQGDPRLAQWAEGLFAPEDATLREIRERSLAAGLPEIQVGKLDGLLLEILARGGGRLRRPTGGGRKAGAFQAPGARRAVEIGTLGGYSGVCLLRGMGPGATLDSFEISEAHAAVARESFRRAGFEGRAHVHVGPAAESLPKLEGKVDLVFIDADKVGYPAYLAWAEDALEVGGLLLADNAFGWGRVADPPGGDDARSIEALQRFAKALATSGRFRATLIPTAEGLAMGVKLR